MTKSNKPEVPIYNWCLKGRHRNIVAAKLFDTRDEARRFLNSTIAPEFRKDWVVKRARIYA